MVSSLRDDDAPVGLARPALRPVGACATVYFPAISDAKEKYGCKLITCIEAQLLEKQEITARMQDLGFSPETYIRDTSFWTPFMETYKRTWLQVKYDSLNPISESDTSYLD